MLFARGTRGFGKPSFDARNRAQAPRLAEMREQRLGTSPIEQPMAHA